MNACSVTPNTAGMESSANRISVLPIATKTTNRGVATRWPSEHERRKDPERQHALLVLRRRRSTTQ